jgi:predicted amidohydrolase YtcJ
MDRNFYRWPGTLTTLLLILALLLAACGTATPQPSDTATPTESGEQPTCVPRTPTRAREPSPSVEPTSAPTKPAASPETSPSRPSPDMIFHNGAIVTMKADQPHAQALAIQGETILAVGTDEGILPLQRPETQVVDLASRTMLPGFIDGHTHVLRSADRSGKTLDEAMELALSYGLTTVNEMEADEPFLDQLRAAERERRLRLRVNVFPDYNAPFLDDEGNTIYMGVWFPERGPILESGRRLRIPGIKIFADGGFTPGRGC